MLMIIDVPDKIYNDIKRGCHSVTYNGNAVATCINNGTPLPKGHGRIADMDAACIKKVYLCNSCYDLFTKHNKEVE